MTLSECCMQIQPLDEIAMQAAQQHWNQLAKPLHSLGRLEDMIVQLAGIHHSAQLEHCRRRRYANWTGSHRNRSGKFYERHCHSQFFGTSLSGGCYAD